MESVTSIKITDTSPINENEHSWAWNGSRDTVPAFLYWLYKYLNQPGRDTVVLEDGTVYTGRA